MKQADFVSMSCLLLVTDNDGSGVYKGRIKGE